MNWLLPAKKCPGLYYGTEAKDGFLLRIRVAGGILTPPQMEAIEILLDCCKRKKMQVTNRGNLQMRGLKESPPHHVYQKLQEVGLASRQLQIDHLRNIMLNPTAGIDREELVDTRVWLKQIIAYMEDNPEKIATLPAKFSIGLDGGGIVGIGSRYNEIQFTATKTGEGILFHLELGGRKTFIPTNIFIAPEYLITCLDSLIEIYRQYVDSRGEGYRLRDLIQEWGVSEYWRRVTALNHFPYYTLQTNSSPSVSCDNIAAYDYKPFPKRDRINPPPGDKPHPEDTDKPHPGDADKPYPGDADKPHPGDADKPYPGDTDKPYPYNLNSFHLGLHRQKQEGLYYLGVALPLGYITRQQWQGLRELVEKSGCGEIRLTPWQSIILPNLSDDTIGETIDTLEKLGLSPRENHSRGNVVACVGKAGCKAGITESETHARMAIEYLGEGKQGKQTPNIHFSGCSKCCAQSTPRQLSFIGCWVWRDGKTVEGYKIYRGDSLIAEVTVEKAISLLPELLKEVNG